MSINIRRLRVILIALTLAIIGDILLFFFSGSFKINPNDYRFNNSILSGDTSNRSSEFFENPNTNTSTLVSQSGINAQHNSPIELSNLFGAVRLEKEKKSTNLDKVEVDSKQFPYGEYGFDNQQPFYRSLMQSLANDIVGPTEKYYVMLKEGSTSIWNRVPMHLLTTFTRVKHFGLYSDIETSIGGYPVYDILKNSSDTLMNDESFKDYHIMNQWHKNRAYLDVASYDLPQKLFKNGWGTDRFKNIPMLAHAWMNTPSTLEWYIFMDGDTFVWWDNMANFLSKYDPDEPHYLGSSFGNLYFGHGGSGVALSRGAMAKVFGSNHSDEAYIHNKVHSYDNATIDNCCGDAMVATAFNDHGVPFNGVPNIQGEPLTQIRYQEDGWCDPIVTFHKCSSWDIEQLWEYERVFNMRHNKGLSPLHKNFRPIRNMDMYLDFVLPFINGSQVAGWDNLIEFEEMYSFHHDDSAADRQKKINNYKEKEKGRYAKYEHWDDPKHYPWVSADDCEALCNAWEDCITWRWMSDILKNADDEPRTVCAIAPYIRFGYPSYTKAYGKDVISGTRPDRIRAFRREQECDPLYKSAELMDNSKVRREGWYWKQ